MNVSAEYAQSRLFALKSDDSFKAFQSSLLPSLAQEAIIGIRMPDLRRLARELHGLQEARCAGCPAFSADEFMQALPHAFFEENSLHILLLGLIKDFDECLARLEAFLPFIDNWATCDIGLPQALARRPEKLLPRVKAWLSSERPYIARYGLGALMSAYMGENFRTEYLSLAASVRSSEYYVNMMQAWYFATALAKHWDAAYPFIEEGRLDAWTHNKAIQKAAESARIPPERKARLKALKKSAKAAESP